MLELNQFNRELTHLRFNKEADRSRLQNERRNKDNESQQ